jgi:hypothetical protein
VAVFKDIAGACSRLEKYDDDDDIFNCNWVATQWQKYSTHIHTNNTENDTKQTIHRTQKYIEQHKKYKEQHKKTKCNTTTRKSAGSAPSLRVSS